MSWLDSLLKHVAPYECIGCQEEGSLLCRDCRLTLQTVPSRCYRCHKLTPGSKTCTSCRTQSPLYRVTPATVYEGLAKDLVWQLKFQGAQAAAREMAQLLVYHYDFAADLILVPIPTATSRVRTRSYDQAQLLAKQIARLTGCEYAPLLRRIGQHHQVGAARRERITQLRGAYRVVRADNLQDKHIILIDDVLTTGATLEAAARTLKAAGVKRVSGAVFAQA